MLSYSTGDTVAATLCSALLWYLLHTFAICVCCGVWWSKLVKAKRVTAREQRERQHAVQIVAVDVGEACGMWQPHRWLSLPQLVSIFGRQKQRHRQSGRAATGSWLRLVIEICRACAVDWVSGVSSGWVAAPAPAAVGAIKYATNWCTHTEWERGRGCQCPTALLAIAKYSNFVAQLQSKPALAHSLSLPHPLSPFLSPTHTQKC